MGFASPNYTQVPNDLLERHMPDMGYAELKVVLAVARRTFGYHQNGVRMSVSDMEKATGLSRKAVQSGAEAAEKRGLIQRKQDGGITYWEIIVDDEAAERPDDGPPGDGSSEAPQGVSNTVEEKKPPTVLPSSTPSNKEIKDSSRGDSPDKENLSTREIDSSPREKLPDDPLKKAHCEVMERWDKALKAIHPDERIKDGAASGRAIKAMLKRGRTPDEIMWAWQTMKAEEFWKDKYLSMVTVDKQIEQKLAARRGNHGGSTPSQRRVIRPGTPEGEAFREELRERRRAIARAGGANPGGGPPGSGA